MGHGRQADPGEALRDFEGIFQGWADLYEAVGIQARDAVAHFLGLPPEVVGTAALASGVATVTWLLATRALEWASTMDDPGQEDW